MFIGTVAFVSIQMLTGMAPGHAHPPSSQSTNQPSQSAQSRVFLQDGRVLNTYGECAVLPDELVCVVKLGGGDVAESFDLLTVPRALVDEERTTAYTQALRAAHYGATRGEQEYTELTNELARVLGELETSTDRDRRLGIAQMARTRLANWSAEHFGYRAEETRQLVSLLDEVIAELRIAAGQTKFSLDLVANLAPVETMPILPNPDVAQSLDAALIAAAVTPLAAERLIILRSAHRVATAMPSLGAGLRTRVSAALRSEELIERQYQALMKDAIGRADVAVRHGRASVLQRLIWEVQEQDQKLGARRPREMVAFGRRLDVELALAKEQQAAFARWEQVKDQLLSYELRLRPLFDTWVSQRLVLRDLRTGAKPTRSALDTAVRRFSSIEASLASMRPPREVAEVHAVLRTAVLMARQGLILGQRLTVAPNTEITQNASAAIAGAELLLAQARKNLVPALSPRKVR